MRGIWMALALGLVASPSAAITFLPGSGDPSVHVASADARRIVLELELPSIDVREIELDQGTFHVLEIPGGGVTGRPGEPMLPTFSRLIQIPDRAAASVRVMAAETTELSGYRPLPMQPEGEDAFVIRPEAYGRVGFGTDERAQLESPALARGVRVVPITFQPVRYDPSRGCLEVATRLRVAIDLGGEDLRNAPARHHASIPPSFDRLYRHLIVNYEGPREGQRLDHGSYVIICPDNGAVVDALEPLVEWRTRKGYDVVLATTAETGSGRSAIRSWLQNAYDTWEKAPEYVVLVGDAVGQVSIPCWFEYWSGREGEGDHPYVQLDGDDVLADAHIGRISVDTVDRLRLYVHKIVSYESTPYMDETDWYMRACLVGDPSESGLTCIQLMQWLKRKLLGWGYTDVDTIFTSPWVLQMVEGINRGDSIFGYRGFFGMSGLETDDVFDLENGRKMPYAVNLTCQTGTFESGTCMTEAWIRAGLPPDIPTGGIASVGTATGGTHTRYNNCVTYGIWQGVFEEGLFEFGPSLTRGKYELYLNYSVQDMENVRIFSHWNNLMGDPAGELWTAVPRAMAVEHPPEIARGANAVAVTVTAGGEACEGAYVCLWKEGETHVGALTDASGGADLPVELPTTGTLAITVTKHDRKAPGADRPARA